MSRRPGTMAGAAGIAILAIVSFAALFAPLVSPFDPNIPTDPIGARYLPPGSQTRIASDGSSPAHPAGERAFFLLGTDKFGRDLFSRVIHGARPALAIAATATLVALVIGILVGSIAGYAGGWTDMLLMRSTDAALAFPRLFVALAALALFGGGAVTVAVVLGLTGWMGVARLARGQVLAVKQRPFVEAARALGESPWRVAGLHILPNAAAPLVADASLRLGSMMLAESTLAFLGLGISPPNPSWGNIIFEGREALTDAWWVTTFPGLAIVLTVLGCYWIGESVRVRLGGRLADATSKG